MGSGRVLDQVPRRACSRRSRRAPRSTLEARLSESPEYRKTLADQVRAELTKAGAANPERADPVGLQAGLSVAHRAGAFPTLKGKGVRGIHIKVAGVQAGPLEEIQVLPGAEPLAARAVSGGRDRLSASSASRRISSASNSSTRRRTSTPLRRSMPPAA